MKRIYLLLYVLAMVSLSVLAQRFPDQQKFYYTNGNGGGLISVSFSYDNQNEPICTAFTGASNLFLVYGSNDGNGLVFYGFEYTPERKMQSIVPGAMAMPVLTGRIIKSRNNNSLSLYSDYSRVVLNGVTYGTRLSENEYNRLYNNIYGNAIGGGYNNDNNGGNGGNRSNYEQVPSRHGDTACHSCNGSGRCSSCNGKGYKFNSYSGHNDTCPACPGSGKCKVCYGKGTIHY